MWITLPVSHTKRKTFFLLALMLVLISLVSYLSHKGEPGIDEKGLCLHLPLHNIPFYG